MNKTLQIILFTLCIYQINGEVSLCSDIGSFPAEVTEKQDRINYCRIRTTTIDKTHCCYYSSDSNEGQCLELSDDQFENIKRYKTFLQNTEKGIKIRCSSEYLTYSLFALLALLF